MNSDKRGSKKLPEGWVLCTSKSNPGRKYYFNKKTGKSSWTEPQAEDKSGHGKHKKRKCSHSEKNKKEEKSLKRKSDSKDGTPSKKKHKEEPPTPEKHNTSTSKKHSPAKPLDTSKTESKPKSDSQKTTPKNTANTRLSQLRTQLTQEAQKEETSSSDKSPSKAKHRISPTITQVETPAKSSKTELKSPNVNESKCSTSQSPSSDSLQSIPSPSQFFAANKIISSMKAHLPEEYCGKQKQKDTFADIEHGICNQTADYPYMKHPATPPQFSEASKLVSAIKSRLSYKVANKESPVKNYSTAKERMEALRARLSSEADTNTSMDSIGGSKDVSYASIDESLVSNNLLYTNKNVTSASKDVTYAGESMDVDIKEVPKSIPMVQCTKDNVGSNKDKDLVLVVDTNIFIHELDFIKDVLNSYIKGYSEQPTLLVPWRVINELDRLKDNNNGNGAICKRAKSAMDYLYKSLPENSRIKGQSLRDANSHIYPCEIPDDEILNCCLQQFERGKAVILLSNDKNLCNKAVINGIRSVGLSEVRSLLQRPPPPPRAAPDLAAGVRHHEAALHQLLANILENEMRAKYNNLWEHVIFKPPPWSLADVLACLLKHWVAVFNEVFPRIEHLIAELARSLAGLQSKDPSSFTESEVCTFKELCLDVSRKCQIIPEYMELAKRTVERLRGGDALPAVRALEGLWTVFSSYCAKLSTGLGIAHDLEDKISTDDPPEVLISKCGEFCSHIAALATALKGSLSSAEGEEEASASRLQAALGASLALVGAGPPPPLQQLLQFCCSCRNMLQEACTKFTQLSELLETCRSKIDGE